MDVNRYGNRFSEYFFKAFSVFGLVIALPLSVFLIRQKVNLGSSAQTVAPPQYITNQLIIKFKDPASANITAALSKQKDLTTGGSIEGSIGIPSLDSLGRKHRLKKIVPLFPDLKQRQIISGENIKQITDLIKQSYPQRTARIPSDSTIPGLLNYYILEFSDSVDINTVLFDYVKSPDVESASLNHLADMDLVPNDPRYPEQWAHQNLNSESGWGVTTGKDTIVLAILDTGMDMNHPDLNTKIHIKTVEIIDGIDNDQNGFIDDRQGWDFVDIPEEYNSYCGPGEDCVLPDNDAADTQGHGTHVAGIAAAITNNRIGVSAVCWGCRIMPLRVGWRNPYNKPLVALDFGVQAIIYAANNGADVINTSWSFEDYPVLNDAANYAYSMGVELVGSAGNGLPGGVDMPGYPGSYDTAVSVTSTDRSDDLSSFSNYNQRADVSSPGENILSTHYDNTYQFLSGTSMAAPEVTGLIGLILSKKPSADHNYIKQVLLQQSDPYLLDSDLVSPVLNFTNPQSSSTISGTVELQVSGTGIPPGVGVNYFLVYDDYYNIMEYIGYSNVSPYKVSWNTALIDNGNYKVLAHVYDLAANCGYDVSDVVVSNPGKPLRSPVVSQPPYGWIESCGLKADRLKYFGRGRINVYKTLSTTKVGTAPADIISPGWDSVIQGIVPVTGTAMGSSFTLEYGRYIYPQSWTQITAGKSVKSGTLGTWDTTSLKGGIYMLRLTVKNIQGYTHDYHKVVVDKPWVKITFPADGTIITGPIKIKSVQWTKDGFSGISTIRYLYCRLSTAPYACTRESEYVSLGTANIPPYSYSWNIASYSTDTYKIKAIITDIYNRQSQSDNLITVQLNNPDTQPPVVAITYPGNYQIVSGIVRILAEASDNFGIRNVEFWTCDFSLSSCLDQGYFEYLGYDSTAPYLSSWDTTLLTSGRYRIKAKAFDLAGNKSENQIIVTVDN